MKYFSNKALDKEIQKIAGGEAHVYTADETTLHLNGNEFQISSEYQSKINTAYNRTDWSTYFGIDEQGNIYVKKDANDNPRHFYSYGAVSAGGLSTGGGQPAGNASLSDITYIAGVTPQTVETAKISASGVGEVTVYSKQKIDILLQSAGSVQTVANVAPVNGDVPLNSLATALGIGSVASGNTNLVTGGTVYTYITNYLTSVWRLVGVTTTALYDGATTNPITINGSSYTASTGDVVLYGTKEFLWGGSAWSELGDAWALWAQNGQLSSLLELKTHTYLGVKNGIYFSGSDIVDASDNPIPDIEIETVNGARRIHFRLPLYSDSWISAGGLSSGGGQASGNASLSDITTLTYGKKGKISITGTSDHLWIYDMDYIDHAIQSAGTIQSVSLAVGASNGTLHLVVNGTAASDVGVTGLGTAAYEAASAFAAASHTHTVSQITDFPSTLPNPYSLTFGNKSYNGSAAVSLSASDIGALTSHQTIYALTIKNSGGTTELTYTPNSGAGSITLTKGMVGLGNVENTALSTWAGSSNITTLGTISTGTWHGSAIANAYLANSSITIGSTAVSLGGSITNLAGIGTISMSGALTISTTKKIYFGDTNHYVELDSNGYFHFSHGLYSDSFVSAGSISSGGGTGGIDLPAMWASLQNNDNVTIYDSYKIHTNHLPTIAGTGITGTYSTSGTAPSLSTSLSLSVDVATILGYTPVAPSALNNYALITNAVKYTDDGSSIGSGSPFSGATAYVNATNLPNHNALVYNSSGYEYSMLFSFASYGFSNGTILRWGHNEKYLYIARKLSDAWQSNDWEKISAGYADDSGKLNGQSASYYATAADYLPKAGGTMSNTNLVTNLNADLLDGYHASYSSNKPYGTIPVITNSGYMDVGAHLEFHYDNTTGSDFSTVLRCTGNHGNDVSLPSASGTLALTSQLADYLPLAGGTMTGNITLGANAIIMGSGYLGAVYTSEPYRLLWYDGGDWRSVWHAGNSNLSTVDWNVNHLYTAGYIYHKDAGGTFRTVLDYDANDALLLGYGGAGAGYDTWVCGNNVILRYGTSRTVGFTLDSSGRVIIQKRTIHLRRENNQAVYDAGVKYDTDGSEGLLFASGYSPARIGFYPGVSLNDVSYSSSNSMLVITTTGVGVGLGTSTPSYKFQVSGDIVATGAITAGSAQSSSDARLKDNIASISNPMVAIMALKPREWDWNKDSHLEGHAAGLVAQEVLPVMPYAVGEVADEKYGKHYTLNYDMFHALEIAGLQSHETRIQQLENRVKELEDENGKLKARLTN